MWAVLIIIVVVLVLASKKRQNEAGQRPESQDQNQTWNQSYQTGNTVKQTENIYHAQKENRTLHKQTSGSSYSQRTEPSRSVGSTAYRNLEAAAGVDADDGAILAAAKVHSYMAEKDNESDSQEDLMQPVYDLMIKGPDTTLTFERDFIGEATDMLNSMQLNGETDV